MMSNQGSIPQSHSYSQGEENSVSVLPFCSTMVLAFGISMAGVRMRSGMRMRTHRMREILLNADKDANAFDKIWEWMQTRILTKAFASMFFLLGLVPDH